MLMIMMMRVVRVRVVLVARGVVQVIRGGGAAGSDVRVVLVVRGRIGKIGRNGAVATVQTTRGVKPFFSSRAY